MFTLRGVPKTQYSLGLAGSYGAVDRPLGAGICRASDFVASVTPP